MISKFNKNADRRKRHERVRNKISGTAARPRLNVYRSVANIYAQIIDDEKGVTLVAASTLEEEIKGQLADLDKKGAAALVGKVIAERALDKDIKAVVFDRGGYLYTGRVQAVAEGAREAGLNF